MDNLDGNCGGRSRHEKEDHYLNDTNSNTPTSELPKGVALMSSSRDAMFYNMNHKRRGVAYIFNHQKFNSCLERHGTDVDSEKLVSCFRKLQFDVILNNDLKLEEIEYQIKIAVETNHNNYDCFVLVVLSHGDVDILWAKDRSYNPKEVIFDKFKSNNCPSLAGKPKLFFIQACQGGGLDSGILLVDRKISRTETDGLRNPYRIPVLADFLIMYATSEGQYAFRNNIKGSYFITVLCEELEKLSGTENLLTILTIVIRRVAVEFESFNDKNVNYHDRKQIPYFQSALTRLVHFYTKNINKPSDGQFISTKRIQ